MEPVLHESNPNYTLNRELLIVEDEGVTAFHLGEHLEKLGCAITAVTVYGEQALLVLEQHCPDLVLMDIRLAGGLVRRRRSLMSVSEFLSV